MWQGDYILSSNPIRWGHENAHPRKYITFPWMRVSTSWGLFSLGGLECCLECWTTTQRESIAIIASKARQGIHSCSYAKVMYLSRHVCASLWWYPVKESSSENISAVEIKVWDSENVMKSETNLFEARCRSISTSWHQPLQQIMST